MNLENITLCVCGVMPLISTTIFAGYAVIMGAL